MGNKKNPALRLGRRNTTNNYTLTQSRLKSLLDYNSRTGVFSWKVDRGPVKERDIAGHTETAGYRVIIVDGKRYLEHRLAWFYIFGAFPSENISHQNQLKDDNRLSNFRQPDLV